MQPMRIQPQDWGDFIDTHRRQAIVLRRAAIASAWITARHAALRLARRLQRRLADHGVSASSGAAEPPWTRAPRVHAAARDAARRG